MLTEKEVEQLHSEFKNIILKPKRQKVKKSASDMILESRNGAENKRREWFEFVTKVLKEINFNNNK